MAKKPAPPPPPPPAQRPPSSSSSEEEEEEENSSSNEEQTNDIEPDRQKTLVEPEERKSESKEPIDEEENDEDDDERLRPVIDSEKITTPSKQIIPEKANGKSPFTRLWSLDDEITILKAMVDYQSEHGLIKMNARGVKDFHESVRKSLSIEVGTDKLAAKIRRLWRKYTDANKKGNKIKFVNPHSKTVYELSKKVWDGDDDDDDAVEALNGDCSGATVNKGKSLKREFPFIRDAFSGNKMALKKLKRVDGEKAAVLEKKFKKLKIEELNLIRKVYRLACKEATKMMD